MGLLIDEFPDIFSHLHLKRNNGEDLYSLKSKSHKSVWWYCQADPDFSHFFKDTIANRTKHEKFKCVICESAGGARKDLLSHWDYQHYVSQSQLNNVSIETLFDWGITSNKLCYWRCPLGHKEPKPVTVASKALRGQGKKQPRAICTRCHSIAHTHPDIAMQYDSENNSKDVWDISAGCVENVNWICPEGHQHSMRVNVKIRSAKQTGGVACNVCSNHKIVPEINSFAALYPQMLREWDYKKNNELKIYPDKISPSAKVKPSWICKKHGSYSAWIGNRTHKTNPTGCRDCKSQTSRNELRIYFELQAVFGDVSHRTKDFGSEIDIYIPKFQLGIEYDGARFHADKLKKDRQQICDLESRNITLIRIREKPLPLLGINDFSYPSTKLMSHYDIVELIDKILSLVPEQPKQAVAATVKQYIDGGIFWADEKYIDTIINRFGVPFEQSLQAKHPKIAGEWDYELNHPYTPDMVSSGIFGNAAGELFRWVCKNNPEHPSYPMAVYARTGRGKQGCPYCSGRYATNSYNLRTEFPKHADMFDAAENFEVNGILILATMVKPNSGKKYNWVCSEGHLIENISPDEITKKEYYGCTECRKISIEKGLHEFPNAKYDHQQIIKSFEAGNTYKVIAEEIGCSLGLVGEVIAKFKVSKGLEIQSSNENPVFCPEANRHFLNHKVAKHVLLKDYGIQANNILGVLNGHSKTSGGLTFKYSKLSIEQVEDQNPNDFTEPTPSMPNNKSKAIYCVELEKHFASKSEAIREMNSLGYGPITHKSLNKAINSEDQAGGFHWEITDDYREVK